MSEQQPRTPGRRRGDAYKNAGMATGYIAGVITPGAFWVIAHALGGLESDMDRLLDRECPAVEVVCECERR